MAKRNRYRAMESMMTKVLLGDAVIFILFMVFAGRGMAFLKVTTAVLATLISVLALAWLFLTREFFRRRSLWMVTACVSILLCLMFSLLLRYPAPAVVSDVPTVLPDAPSSSMVAPPV